MLYSCCGTFRTRSFHIYVYMYVYIYIHIHSAFLNKSPNKTNASFPVNRFAIGVCNTKVDPLKTTTRHI